MTLKISDITPVYDSSPLIESKHILCITEDALMKNDNFFDVLEGKFGFRSTSTLDIKRIAFTNHFFDGVVNALSTHRATLADPLSYFSDCCLFVDFDRLCSAYYKGRNDESQTHRNRISSLDSITDTDIFIIPSFPCVNTFFAGFFTDDYFGLMASNTHPKCRSCSTTGMRSVNLHGACVVHSLSHNGHVVGIKLGTKRLFTELHHLIIDSSRININIKNNLDNRSRAGIRLSIEDLEIKNHLVETLYGNTHWYSFIDSFVDKYYKIN